MLYKPKKKSFTYWLWCSTCYTIRIIDLEIESQKFSFTSQDEEIFYGVKLSKHSPVIRDVRIPAPSTKSLSFVISSSKLSLYRCAKPRLYIRYGKTMSAQQSTSRIFSIL